VANYAPRRTTFDTGDRRWLPDMLSAETHGVTIDAPGFYKSGTHIGIVTATKRGGRYSNAATDGRQESDGLLLNDLQVNDGELHHVAVVHAGTVDRRFLPADSGHDAAAEADLTAIAFIR
jgi:hypothetical protein